MYDCVLPIWFQKLWYYSFWIGTGIGVLGTIGVILLYIFFWRNNDRTKL